MDFFDGKTAEYRPQFKQNDKVIFSGTISRDNFKKQMKKSRGNVLSKFIIAVLATIMYLVFRWSGVLVRREVSICALVVIGVLYLLSVLSVLRQTGKKEYMRIGSQSVVFDFTNETVVLVRGSGSLVLPADAISDVVEEGEEVILVSYRTHAKKSERKAMLRDSGRSFRPNETMCGVIACQKNLLTVGEADRALSFAREKAEEYKAKDRERRNNIKAFAVTVIILSVTALALTYPCVFGGKLLLDYLQGGEIFEKAFSILEGIPGVAAILLVPVSLVLALIFVIVLVFVAVILRVLPVPLLVASLILWFVQLGCNRKKWTWISLAVMVVGFIGSFLIMFVT